MHDRFVFACIDKNIELYSYLDVGWKLDKDMGHCCLIKIKESDYKELKNKKGGNVGKENIENS